MVLEDAAARANWITPIAPGANLSTPLVERGKLSTRARPNPIATGAGCDIVGLVCSVADIAKYESRNDYKRAYVSGWY